MYVAQSYDRADSRMEGATEQDCAKKRTDANNIRYFITEYFYKVLFSLKPKDLMRGISFTNRS